MCVSTGSITVQLVCVLLLLLAHRLPIWLPAGLQAELRQVRSSLAGSGQQREGALGVRAVAVVVPVVGQGDRQLQAARASGSDEVVVGHLQPAHVVQAVPCVRACVRDCVRATQARCALQCRRVNWQPLAAVQLTEQCRPLAARG